MLARDTSDTFALPPLTRWMQVLIASLFVLYLIEVVARNFLFLPVDVLAWQPLRASGDLYGWQLLSHFLVQGPGRGAAMNTILFLLVLWFLLPSVANSLRVPPLVEAILCSLLVGLGLAVGADFAVDLVRWGGAPAYGWSAAATALTVLFGLTFPGGVIRLYFVIPIRGAWLVWGTVAITALFVVAEPCLDSIEQFGATLGAIAWWNLRGPERRRRHLRRQARVIERELDRFKVIEGGRRNDEYINRDAA
jgi:hypothetical protein